VTQKNSRVTWHMLVFDVITYVQDVIKCLVVKKLCFNGQYFQIQRSCLNIEDVFPGSIDTDRNASFLRGESGK